MSRWSVRVDPAWSVQAWRDAARLGLQHGVAPDQLDWLQGGDASLLDAPPLASLPARQSHGTTIPVPKSFVELASTCLCHSDPQRHALLYRMLWRIVHGERGLLINPADPDVLRAMVLSQAVRRDSHKMKAFVRFREVPGEDNAFIAWFEPDHHIVDRVAPFFARRFAGMRWAILTPTRSVRWDGQELAFGPGSKQADAPVEDAREELWRTYYANIFNPARLNTRMMRQEMPTRYWKHLPEASLLPTLVRDAGDRVQEMHDREAQAPQRRIPEQHIPLRGPATANGDSLDELRTAAAGCRRCPLWEPATQTVFGEGPRDAQVMLVGEQPGDSEDLSGHPFVGPAGQLLNRALQALGIDRSALYLTNAVKHFRYERRGKKRIHSKPQVTHINACRPWLLAEIEQVSPKVIVCLGATAARAVFGPGFNLGRDRGRWHTLEDGTRGFATVHPSWVLRQPVGAAQEEAYQLLLGDLERLSTHAGNGRTE